MAKPIREASHSIKPNPFTAYRDPCTGQWCIVQPTLNGIRIVAPTRPHAKPSSRSQQRPLAPK